MLPSSSSTAISPTPSQPSSPHGLSRRMSWNRPREVPLEIQIPRSTSRYADSDGPRPHFTYNGETGSQASLDSPVYGAFDDVRLTTEGDPERVSRYEDAPSPLKRGGDALRTVSRNIRRLSVRVVNLGAVDGQVRLEEPAQGEEIVEEQPPTSVKNIGPLRGRTLGFLHPTSRVRLSMYQFLVYKWTEPAILLLIIINTVVLAIQAARNLFATDPYPQGALSTWEDVILFILFVIFSLETVARVTVSGLLLDPEIPISSLFSAPFQSPFSIQNIQSRFSAALSLNSSNISRLKQPTQHQRLSSLVMPKYLPFEVAFHVQRSLARRGVPYLRHSWSRVDFLAIVSFWIHFCLSMFDLERTSTQHIGIFRALSVLRTTRLLAITQGTTTILQSLKTARPLLANVAFFVIFAMILFSIVGIQSFKGSFLRQCVVALPDGTNATYGQFCGGYIDPISLEHSSFIERSGAVSPSLPRGYICPLGQICQEQGENPESGLQNYDNIFAALLQVIVISSVNTWAPVMYASIDAEFFVSCIFYILGVIVLNFWLINLFVAVITSTFSSIRSATKKSAFGANTETVFDLNADGKIEPKLGASGLVQKAYERTRYLWPILIVASVGLQASKNPNRSRGYIRFLDTFELVITLLFDVEILWRFLAYMPRWRMFWGRPANVLDLFLAIICSVIQLPPVHNASFFPWLTCFQLARFYRVIIVFPRMKPLLVAVFGNLSGLMNMIMFLLLTIFLSALMGVQMIRGDLTSDINMNFGHIFNGFLAMYQVFSSENWTTVLYNVGQDELPLRQSIVTILFICAWFLFANFIILQMFVAVLHENIEVAEESSSKLRSRNRNSAQPLPRNTGLRWLSKLSRLPGFLPARGGLVLSDKPEMERLSSDYSQASLGQIQKHTPQEATSSTILSIKASPTFYSMVKVLNKFFAGDQLPDEIPLMSLNRQGQTDFSQRGGDIEVIERHLEVLASLKRSNTILYSPDDSQREERQFKIDYLSKHPSYNTALWLFPQGNPFRKWCQSLVRPPNGERLFGPPQSPTAFAIIQCILFSAVIAGIVIAAVATPLYRHNFYLTNTSVRIAWFDVAESAFALALVVEFLLKVIADGFALTPNPYIRDIWNVIDFTIMLGLLVNVSTTFIVVGGLNRVTRSLTALRALRLLTLIDNNRLTFQSLIFAGASRILDAVLLAMLYLIPYAVWGLNIFSGLMFSCNDNSITDKGECKYEYTKSIIDDNNLAFFAPRVWDNPHTSTSWSFDDFPSSLLILFEIVSLEGWIDVLAAAVGISGKDKQPVVNASQANALFFLFFNLLGGVVILTIFVSIIIGNFSRKTGTAFLTQPQRDWINLHKLLIRQKPSKRPLHRPTWSIRGWCYDRAVNKHGWWAQMMTALFILHIIVLMTQTFISSATDNKLRDDFFLLVTCIYAVDIIVRLFGLGLTSFRSNGWNIFDVMTVTGSFATTIPIRLGSTGFATEQLQKLFLVIIAFKLVQRSNQMNQLFKTSRSSIPDILNLLGLWLTFFIFFGILYMEVFGLTRWESAETHEQNFSSLGRALVMLAFMSTGEGWNQYMHDFALTYPRCTNSTPEVSISDCGSSGWAYVLFITWNVLSMYIFVNMFTGVVVESFSYVTQVAGGSKSIGREEMRVFKKTWAEFCTSRTGVLEPDKFTPFFAKLTGAFEVRIYPVEFSIANLRANAASGDGLDYSTGKRITHGIDLYKLDRALAKLDVPTLRKRRTIYNRVVLEALKCARYPASGLSFTEALLLIAHNKLIDDENALSPKELAKRKETNVIVQRLLDYDRVHGLFLMAYERRKFLDIRAARRKETIRAIPAIVVEGLSTTPPHSSPWIRSPGNSPDNAYYEECYSDREASSPSRTSTDHPLRSDMLRAISPSSPTEGIRSSIYNSALSPDGEDSSMSPNGSKWGEIMRRVSVRVSPSSPRQWNEQGDSSENAAIQDSGL